MDQQIQALSCGLRSPTLRLRTLPMEFVAALAEDIRDGWPVRMTGTACEWKGTVVGLNEDGSQFFTRVAMTPERSQDGMPIGFLAIASDMVEDVILDVELHRTPAYAHSPFESVPDAMVIVSARDDVQFANAEAAILLGDSHVGAGRSDVEMLIADRYLDLHPGVRMGFFSESRTPPSGLQPEHSVQSQSIGATCYVHKRVAFKQCCDVVRTMRLLWRRTEDGTLSHV